ncbi:MAG: hypothetical protein JNK74_18880 [Candidatus Hydrogenedentes bacterium]|nr:hypothetical protein [Candidatus Hydrogenedentota bacterium]
MRAQLIIAALLLAMPGVPVAAQAPQQVQVSVKVIEFQTSKDVETGLSAYFKQRTEPQPYGRADSGVGSISSSDITFPTSTTSGITVFLDRLVTKYGDIEVVLQGLVEQGRAFILSQPTALVPVAPANDAIPTIIKTAQQIPYEDKQVFVYTPVSITAFKDTGVSLTIQALAVVDDDADPNTRGDTYIRLNLIATVKEEGQRITVALDENSSSGGLLGDSNNAIQVPEFVSREIKTEVWVRHGQVLMLGGLYRDTDEKDLSTLPWLSQGDRFMNGLIQRVVPFAVEPVPLSSSIGNNKTSDARRELAFLIKADVPALIYDETTASEEKESFMTRPTEVVTGVLRGLTQIPQGIAEGVTGENLDEDISTGLQEDEKE